MPTEAILAAGSFVLLSVLWVVLPSRLHKGQEQKEN
jgi:hypothetical protein